MICSVVVPLRAVQDGRLDRFTGKAVHGFWLDHWRHISPRFSKQLHAPSPCSPYTLSPLMGLPKIRNGIIDIRSGTQAWMRIATLTDELSERLYSEWLVHLPETMRIAGVFWQVNRSALDELPKIWTAQANQQELADQYLLVREPARQWFYRFLTPTAFHAEAGHFPIPLPVPLVRSWMRRWEAFGSVHLPEDFSRNVSRGVVVSAYELKSVLVHDSKRKQVGGEGWITLKDTGLSVGERALMDLLSVYSFWTGSGHHTTQGMGMTLADSYRKAKEDGSTVIAGP